MKKSENTTNDSSEMLDQGDISARLAELEKEVEGQRKLLEQVVGRSEEMHRYLIMRRVWIVIKVLVIVVPLVFAIIYLPPIIERAIAPYREIMSRAAGISGFSLEKYFTNTQKEQGAPSGVSAQQ